MKRLLAALALVLGPSALPLAADEPPHFDFVRGLRARQFPDLALEYLERLRKSNPPPEVAALIPLEAAKVRLDLAAGETEMGRRLDLYAKARAEFEQFIAANPQNPLVAEARLEVARVAVLQAKTQLGRALRRDDRAAAIADAEVARRMFADAHAGLKAVATQLDRQLAEPRLETPANAKDKAEKAALLQARLQADLDLGLNLIDQAQTFLDESKDELLLARAKVIGEAVPLLEQLAVRDLRNPLCWQARSWLGHCYFENGDPKKARDKLREVIDAGEPAAAAGRRLARYFRMRIIDKAPEKNDGDPRAVVRDAAERWLNDYRTFRGSAEGCGVRYLLAKTYIDQAGDMTKPLPRPQRTLLHGKARDLCRELENPENDFTEKARVLKIHLFKADGGDTLEIAKIAVFDDCLLRRAQLEVSQIKDAKPEEFEKVRKERLDNAVAALRRGLDLAAQPTNKVPPTEVSRARALLTGYFLFTGRPQEAIDAGEEVAKSRPANAQKANTAVYVLQAYSDLVNKSLREGASFADLEADGKLKKMRDLAEYMEKTWPSESAADIARHQRGLLLLKEKKNVEGLGVLATVTTSYPGIVFVRYQMSLAAFQAAQDADAQAKTDPDAARRDAAAKSAVDLERRGVEALQSLPPLPSGADALTAGAFLAAKVDLGRALYKAKRFAEIDKVVDPVLAALDKGDYRFDSAAKKTDARANLVLIKLYGRYGVADAAFVGGRIAEVKAVVDPIAEAVQKGDYPELKKNLTLRWGLMGLALRVHIQEGNTAKAKELLDAVQKFAAEDDGAAGSQAVLAQLVSIIEKQVRDVRKKKDPVLFEKTVAGFGAFLDRLSAGQTTATPEFLRILAEAYAGFELHDKAVEFARRVPEPKGENGQPPDPKRLRLYAAAQIFAVRELRLGNKVDEAEAALKIVREAPWAKGNIEADKERIHLLAARGRCGAAVTEWNKIVNSLVGKLTQPGAKEQYFECYAHSIDCLYRYALSLPAGKGRDDVIRRAASNIVKLETNFPDLGGEEAKARFDDLLEREPPLKKEYDLLKGAK